jgi:hypothetical protein
MAVVGGGWRNSRFFRVDTIFLRCFNLLKGLCTNTSVKIAEGIFLRFFVAYLQKEVAVVGGGWRNSHFFSDLGGWDNC